MRPVERTDMAERTTADDEPEATAPADAADGGPAPDDLYVVYWVDEQGYGGSCEFVHASSTDEAREQSSYASGGVAHQRLLFAGSFAEFRAYVEEELEDVDRFELVWN